ncbi:MAG: hypothetical protein LBR29_02675 [Methylobacteriaceae bacterium]|nr:hypothetical protein [Methylobacteriaceae bacterium]
MPRASREPQEQPREIVEPQRQQLTIEGVADEISSEIEHDQAHAVTVLGEKHEQIIGRLGQIGEILTQLADAQKLIEKLETPLRETFQHHQSQRSENIALHRAFESARIDVSQLRERESSLAARVASLEMELKHLHEAHAQALTAQHAVEEELKLSSNDIRVRDADVAELQRRLSDLSVELAHTKDDLQDARNQIHEQEAVYNSLDQELRREREQRQTIEQEHESLQASVQQAVSEAIHMSKRLADTESSAAEARARALQLEGQLTDLQAERSRINEELDALRLATSEEKRGLSVKAEGLRSRAATLEKLLGETRSELAKQTESLRDAQRKMTEMSIALNRAEAKAEKAISGSQRADAENKNLEQSRITLMERADMLSKAIKAKDAALKRSEERTTDLSDRLNSMETKMSSQVETYERRISELTTALEREKTERALLEGALDAARQDKARVQKELIKIRSRVADDTYGEDISTDETPSAAQAAASEENNVAPLHGSTAGS